MGKTEFSITVPPGGTVPPDVTAAAAAAAQNGETAPAVSRKRAQLHQTQHEQAAARAAAEAESVETETEVAPPREDVESVELELPDHRVVVFGPPVGLSLTARVAMLYGSQNASDAADMIARVCLSVRSIDGKRPAPITNMVDLQKIANQLGDNGLDVLAHCLREYWPGVKLSELRIVKKNLRG